MQSFHGLSIKLVLPVTCQWNTFLRSQRKISFSSPFVTSILQKDHVAFSLTIRCRIRNKAIHSLKAIAEKSDVSCSRAFPKRTLSGLLRNKKRNVQSASQGSLIAKSTVNIFCTFRVIQSTFLPFIKYVIVYLRCIFSKRFNHIARCLLILSKSGVFLPSKCHWIFLKLKLIRNEKYRQGSC